MDMNKAIKIVDGAIDYMIVEADDAWRIIRKELEKAQNKSTNTGSPKLLCELEECVRLLSINLEYNRGAVTEKLNAVIAQLRAGA